MLLTRLRGTPQSGLGAFRTSIGCTTCPDAARYSLLQFRYSRVTNCPGYLSISKRNGSTEASPENAFKERVQKIKEAHPEPYPRLGTDNRRISCKEFLSRYNHLANNETVDGIVVLHGRIRSSRQSGSKLRFFDLFQDGHKVQILCNQHRIAGVTPAEFKESQRIFRRGDAFSVAGKPHRTQRGELSLEATELPQLLSPCLHDIPLDREDPETSPHSRVVQFLNQNKLFHVTRARSAIIQYIRQFLLDRSFMEVSTPVLASTAGGAIARPFYTSATEFPERQLSLRIAPELWLKRFVVGGFDKVFEIGPSFRNEGLDRTHNPEFTTCEFYHAYANLEDLMSMTESLFTGIAEHISQLNEAGVLEPTTVNFTAPFRRIDFTTGIEEKIGRRLPDLTSADAQAQVQQIFHDISLPLPDNPTLARLMDELCSVYLEPQCVDPTFIINPPECLSPLSKTFIHPTNKQRVAARGELFIEGHEMVNTYEEENSPFEQRRKFEEQARENRSENENENESGEVDESYLSALEWGLPPTGGWGCGIDRLCMLFTGMKRINDVLPFGNLRAVTPGLHEVALSKKYGMDGDSSSK